MEGESRRPILMFYLDTSAIVSLFLRDDHSSVMQAWTIREKPRVILGDFAAVEFAATVSRYLRMRLINRRKADETLADFDSWRSSATEPRATQAGDFASCERLVRDFDLKLAADDALHLAIAMAERTTLVTLDKRLAAAARRLEHPWVVPQ